MFKIVLMGPSKSGKTTIFKNINGPFIYVENIRMMLGVDFYELKYEHHNVLAKISLWDINSHPRFLSLYPQFIRGAKAFVVVFNLMRRETFENVQHWIQLSRSKEIELPYGFLVGNKVEEAERAVTFEQGIEMASKWGLVYIQLSAKSDEDVQDMFERVIILVAN